ncbi:MAG: NfeD family protein [Campylobacterales bacterium]|jgi:membrane protein implicated in regulation of membrane protease activity
MLDWLNVNVLWWHWVILGMIFLVLETMAMTFLMLGIGIASILTGVLAYFLDLSFASELLIWSVLSAAFIVGWWRFIRQKTVTQSGQPHYRLDTEGTVEEAIEPPQRGRVLFDIPVLGNREWPAFADEPLEVGAKVQIVDVSGQLIKVKRIKEA